MSGAQSLAVVVMPCSPTSIQQTGEDEASMTPQLWSSAFSEQRTVDPEWNWNGFFCLYEKDRMKGISAVLFPDKDAPRDVCFLNEK